MPAAGIPSKPTINKGSGKTPPTFGPPLNWLRKIKKNTPIAKSENVSRPIALSFRVFIFCRLFRMSHGHSGPLALAPSMRRRVEGFVGKGSPFLGSAVGPRLSGWSGFHTHSVGGRQCPETTRLAPSFCLPAPCSNQLDQVRGGGDVLDDLRGLRTDAEVAEIGERGREFRRVGDLHEAADHGRGVALGVLR